jgi:hypothetical protein
MRPPGPWNCFTGLDCRIDRLIDDGFLHIVDGVWQMDHTFTPHSSGKIRTAASNKTYVDIVFGPVRGEAKRKQNKSFDAEAFHRRIRQLHSLHQSDSCDRSPFRLSLVSLAIISKQPCVYQEDGLHILRGLFMMHLQDGG